MPRVPVGTAVDQVVPASHDSWTPIVELAHVADRNASERRTSMPVIVSACPAPGVGIAAPPLSRPKVDSCCFSVLVFSVA